MTEAEENPVEERQEVLPFEGDGTSEAPVPYALTARARRMVAPATLPELEVLPEPEGDDAAIVDPFDTRPARARALRRSGRSVARIAELLDVGEELVARWCGGVGDRRSRAARRNPAATVTRPAPIDPEARRAARERFETAAAAQRLGPATGVLAALAEVTGHGVSVTVGQPGLAALVAAWLRDHAGLEPGRLRLVLEVGPAVARDVVAHAWARAIDVAAGHVTHTSWDAAPRSTAVRGTLRVTDPAVAAVVAGLCDALREARVPADA